MTTSVFANAALGLNIEHTRLTAKVEMYTERLLAIDLSRNNLLAPNFGKRDGYAPSPFSCFVLAESNLFVLIRFLLKAESII
jgi:hypothetical protein